MSNKKSDIINALENTEQDLSINEIAEATGYTRQTVSKYITVLSAEGKVTCIRQVGNAKFFDIDNDRR